MTTPSLNPNAVKRHARAARVDGYVPPTQIDRLGLAKFARNASVQFSHYRDIYTGTTSSSWGYYLRWALAGTKYKDFLDDLFHVTTGSP